MKMPWNSDSPKIPVFDEIPVPSSEFPDAEWELITRTFIDPKHIVDVSDPSLTKIALCGMTTYVFLDKKHNVFKTMEVFGMEQTSLDRLLDKVDVGGPEYVLRDGKTYVLLRQPEGQGSIPIKK